MEAPVRVSQAPSTGSTNLALTSRIEGDSFLGIQGFTNLADTDMLT